jgi:hypothetical protein
VSSGKWEFRALRTAVFRANSGRRTGEQMLVINVVHMGCGIQHQPDPDSGTLNTGGSAFLRKSEHTFTALREYSKTITWPTVTMNTCIK